MAQHSIDHILPNPYRHIKNKERELSRLSADVSYEDKDFLHLIYPAKGLFNRLTQIFFHSIVEECKAHGITTYTPANADFVARLIARRCTVAQPTGQVNSGHDPGRTPQPRHDAPRGFQQSGDAEEAP
jgi:hypothetical protein